MIRCLIWAAQNPKSDLRNPKYGGTTSRFFRDTEGPPSHFKKTKKQSHDKELSKNRLAQLVEKQNNQLHQHHRLICRHGGGGVDYVMGSK
jgi:hypothetical protein